MAAWGVSGALRVACLVLMAMAAGCAYVTAVPVKPGFKVSGIRIYDVKPLLIVDGATTQIQMVPNYNRAYALQFGAFLAKNDFQAKMANGVLSEVHANMDSTDFIKVLEALIEKLPAARGLSDAGSPNASTGVKDRFQVYDIIFDDDGNLVQLKPLIYPSDLLKLKSPDGAAAGVAGTPAKVVQQADPGAGGGDGVNTGPVTDD